MAKFINGAMKFIPPTMVVMQSGRVSGSCGSGQWLDGTVAEVGGS